GNIILQTAFPVSIGDEYIDQDNTRYRVASLKAWDAIMEIANDKSDLKKSLSKLWQETKAVQAPLSNANRRIAIFHTHSDESYLPSTGTESELEGGGILRVGYALASSLVQDGIIVDQSFALHGPHDINAYHRSRRTMFKMLKDSPAAIFDVHRDAAPAEAYFTYITGVESARIMIVVGRQNPNMNANLAFAKQVKEKADQIYPGLIRGIFIGRGSYNQDLSPRALLLEIGTHRLSEQLAQNAAHCIGDVISALF
ncbi:MAG: stage II sporulation protein P, partial [Syntrophomonadaceae bacterium]|nr:stage II sporulation protein P [Syntrophomonadaceae bacterium]